MNWMNCRKPCQPPPKSMQFYWYSRFSTSTGRNARTASTHTWDTEQPFRRECWELLCSVHLKLNASNVKLLWKILRLLECMRETYFSAGKEGSFPPPPPPQLIMLLGAAWSIAASSGSSLGAGCKPGKSSLEESKEWSEIDEMWSWRAWKNYA